MRILILTTEPLPLPGKITTGAGLRAWGLARGLESAGFPSVELAMPEEAAAGGIEGRVHCFSRPLLTEFVRERSPDVLVLQHWGLMRHLGEVEMPIAIDLAGPHLLERRFWGSRSPEGDLAEKIEALRRADFVTCSGRSQRLYFLPFLGMAGFDVGDPDLCPVIPFSADPQLPASRERDPTCFVYGGMFLPWQDPSRALTTLLDVLASTAHGRLRFFGGAHPTVDVSGGKFGAILERLSGDPRVEMNGLVPFEQLVEAYCRAGVALDLMERNAERELAFPTRTVIYLWCGLPVIHGDYDDLAPLIARYEAGWILSPDDQAGLRATIASILSEPARAAERGDNARRLVAENLTWDKTIAPLAAWCRNPHRRENKTMIALRNYVRERQIAELESELADCRRQLDTLRGKWIFRLYRANRLWGPLLAPVAFLAATFLALILFFLLFLTRRKTQKPA
ncbi:MAG: glycosyltransferase family 4 protein [Candidatus Sumerlaeia bacterium]|nr:glycosyltransferase family 4 protein [Candidatus Sumerlaeia bacterium]